jgi:hypothetical protein
MNDLEEFNALAKDIIDLISSRRLRGRYLFVALADVVAFVIKQSYKPEDRDESVEWFASAVKRDIEQNRDDNLDEAALIRLWHQKRGDQSEENE